MADAFLLFDHNRRKIRNFRTRTNSLDDLSDSEIQSRYRLDREGILYLVDLIGAELERKCKRSQPIPPLTQILIGLRYLAKGDFFSEVGDLHGVSKSTVSLIPIIAPTHQEEAYRCRKGFHAVNVQAVTDCNLKFIDLVAKWPDSQHDSAIFNSCGLKTYLEENPVGLLLGDSGNALKRYLLNPKLQATTPQEERYNAAHKTGRVVVERAFGVLKSRFRCLHRSGGCLPFRPEKCTKVVTACVRLHNLCCDRGIPIPDGNYTNDVVDDQIVQPDGGNAVTD